MYNTRNDLDRVGKSWYETEMMYICPSLGQWFILFVKKKKRLLKLSFTKKTTLSTTIIIIKKNNCNTWLQPNYLVFSQTGSQSRSTHTHKPIMLTMAGKKYSHNTCGCQWQLFTCNFSSKEEAQKYWRGMSRTARIGQACAKPKTVTLNFLKELEDPERPGK